MGFPAGYHEILVPKLFLHLLFFLASLRSVVFSLFHLLHLSDLLDTDDLAAAASPDLHHQTVTPTPTLSAILIRELLPVATFSDLAGETSPAAGCAVCLCEFSDEEEIRCMANCRHIFHRACVDRWIDYDQKSCPLCRTHFVPHHKMEDYNQRLWDASSVSQFCTLDDDDASL